MEAGKKADGQEAKQEGRHGGTQAGMKVGRVASRQAGIGADDVIFRQKEGGRPIKMRLGMHKNMRVWIRVGMENRRAGKGAATDRQADKCNHQNIPRGRRKEVARRINKQVSKGGEAKM